MNIENKTLTRQEIDFVELFNRRNYNRQFSFSPKIDRNLFSWQQKFGIEIIPEQPQQGRKIGHQIEHRFELILFAHMP